MDEPEEEKTESVSVTMELSGEYDAVVSKLAESDHGRDDIQAIALDFAQLLDTIDAIDGGTKSVIVENLPDNMTVPYDSDTVVNSLQVLERYDLVTLDGNTWMIAD